MNSAALHKHLSRGASISNIPDGYRLSIPRAHNRQYALAQLDDYTRLPRRRFPHRELTLSLKARVSAASLPGTWGFGVWNDPFGLNLGFTGSAIRLPALPNAAWFFHASSHNYLSFRGDKPAQGFLAQAFRSPYFDPRIMLGLASLLLNRKYARRIFSGIIEEDSSSVTVAVTQWQHYELSWLEDQTSFRVNGQHFMKTNISPKAPLGIVIWIDNQYAAFSPDGKFGFGVLENPEPAWLEIKEINIHES